MAIAVGDRTGALAGVLLEECRGPALAQSGVFFVARG